MSPEIHTGNPSAVTHEGSGGLVGKSREPPGGLPGESHEAQTIATLRAGDAVDAVFACTRKERLLTRSGDPYLALELGDQGGTSRRGLSAMRICWRGVSSAAIWCA